ncbi:hypothetical protein Pint_07426 [Pistacia integerrima]|uniref:Uncharacterized protein n=1 Tax=Pistacia integerrima TaxID=434235 RepID=A0ACC0XUL4_9ROSI|nr:hypothetical protein Pint_07426 [Pistacia integerrima]
MELHGSGCPGLTLQSSAEKNPALLDAAICVSNPCSLDNGPSSGKASKGATGRLLKRCTAHVYISRPIQDLKIPEKKQKLSLQRNQVKPPQEEYSSAQEALSKSATQYRGISSKHSAEAAGSVGGEANNSLIRIQIA